MKSSEKQTLSIKRYGIARLIRYISFIVIVLMFFMPILSLKGTDTIFGQKATVSASMSPFQFMIGQSEVKQTVHVSGNSSAGDFLGAFAGEIDIFDVFRGGFLSEFDSLQGDPMIFVRIFIFAYGLIMMLAYGIYMTSKTAINTAMLMAEAKGKKQWALNNLYIKEAIWGLPRVLKIIETLLSSLTISCIIAFYFLSIGYTKIPPDYILCAADIIIFIIAANHIIERTICKKDSRLIAEEDLRYDIVGEKPTFSSDMKAIKYIFSNKTNAIANVPKQTNNIDELYKYKKLLDDGIISEEEFQEKKNELLNSKKDNV